MTGRRLLGALLNGVLYALIMWGVWQALGEPPFVRYLPEALVWTAITFACGNYFGRGAP